LTLLNCELDAVSFVKVAKPVPFDSGVMYKDIAAAVASYEAITFLSVEPLDSSSFTIFHG
jgi:hypothetical protein